MALQRYYQRAGLLALLALLSAGAAHAQRAGIGIEEAWVRAHPANPDSATGFLTLRNAGRVPLVLKGMRCTDVRRVVIHETVTERRISRMEGRDSLIIAPGAYVPMRPGGLHLMMGGVRPPLSVGSRLACHLITNAGEVALNVEIRAPEARRTNP